MAIKQPFELAQGACRVAVAKAGLKVQTMMLLGILAGAYIGFGGWLMTVVVQDAATFAGVGITKVIAGSVFSVGLILVVIGGAELFTGNCLMPLGSMAGCLPVRSIVRAWVYVYIANFIGACLVAVLVYLTGLWDGAAGAKALSIAAGKMNLSLSQAFFRGVLCNWLVVLAVWLSMAATDVIGKIGAIYFPIMAFVASGFEHSIANMYFMMLGLLLKGHASVVTASGVSDAALSAVGVGGYLHNLIPVTLGNMVGGILFVAVLYFYIFRDRVEGLEL